GFGSQDGQGWTKQVTVSFFVGSSDAAPELVQVTQSKLMGIVDNDRIRIGNVKTSLDDSGTQQQIVFTVDVPDQGVFELLAFHLVMCNCNVDVRAQTGQ